MNKENASTVPILDAIDSFATALVGGDTNFDRIFFTSKQQLLPGTSFFTKNIFEWDEGTLRVAGVLPDGSIPAGGSETAIPESGSLTSHDSVSTDGSRLLFLASMGGPISSC